MAIPWNVIVLSLAGFVFGLSYTGTWKDPKHAPFSIVLNIKKDRYHIHHWLFSIWLVGTFLFFDQLDIVSIGHAPLKYMTAFISGYGLQGFFVKDAFRIKNYERFKARPHAKSGTHPFSWILKKKGRA